MWLEPGESDEPIALTMFESLLEPTVHPHIETHSTPTPTYIKYYALSYVWGTETELMPITVNGKAFRIKPNLHSFLKYCRDKDEPDAWRGPFWTDAICINQQDLEEKSAQVNMMDKIYGHTTCCVVWLGQEDKETQLAFNLFRAIENVARITWRMVHWQSHKPFPYDDESTTDPADLDGNETWRRLAIRARIHGIEDPSSPFCDQAWIAVFNLIRRPWFQRVWTFQEFVVPRQVEILCACKYGRAPGYVPGTDYMCVKACIARLNYQSSALPSTRYLFRYVTAAIERESTDARDKIFAFVGVSTDKAVTADYKSSVREVYHEFAVYCIYHFLDDLYWALGARKEIDNLPSWAPDWSVPWRNAWTLEFRSPDWNKNPYEGAGLPRSLHKPKIALTRDKLELWHPGVFVDTIRRVFRYKFKQQEAYANEFEDRMKQFILEEGLSDEKFRPASQTSHDILMRTVSCDCIIADFTTVRLNQSPSMTEQMGNGSGISVMRYDDHQDLFITESGYMGLGVPIIKKGDSVVVLIGVAFPIVLRREKEWHQMIGPCFVHGIMDGEIIKTDLVPGAHRLLKYSR